MNDGKKTEAADSTDPIGVEQKDLQSESKAVEQKDLQSESKAVERRGSAASSQIRAELERVKLAKEDPIEVEQKDLQSESKAVERRGSAASGSQIRAELERVKLARNSVPLRSAKAAKEDPIEVEQTDQLLSEMENLLHEKFRLAHMYILAKKKINTLYHISDEIYTKYKQIKLELRTLELKLDENVQNSLELNPRPDKSTKI